MYKNVVVVFAFHKQKQQKMFEKALRTKSSAAFVAATFAFVKLIWAQTMYIMPPTDRRQVKTEDRATTYHVEKLFALTKSNVALVFSNTKYQH